jgi:hypothetical protein
MLEVMMWALRLHFVHSKWFTRPILFKRMSHSTSSGSSSTQPLALLCICKCTQRRYQLLTVPSVYPLYTLISQQLKRCKRVNWNIQLYLHHMVLFTEFSLMLSMIFKSWEKVLLFYLFTLFTYFRQLFSLKFSFLINVGLLLLCHNCGSLSSVSIIGIYCFITSNQCCTWTTAIYM